MPIIAYLKPTRVPIPVTHQCPAGCDLPDMIECWLRRERELRADLAAARGSDDAEVLWAAESRIDPLIALGRRAA